MSIRGTHCRTVPACPLSLSLLSLHGGSENCQSSDWLVPDKGPLNGRVCVCVLECGLWWAQGTMTREAQGPHGEGAFGGRPRRCGLLSKFCDDLLCNDTAVQRYIRSTFAQSVTRLQTSVRQAVTSALNSLQQAQAARLRVSSKSINKFESNTHTHTRLTARFSGTARVSRYQKGKANLDFTEAGDSEWQWHQLGHMQVCT